MFLWLMFISQVIVGLHTNKNGIHPPLLNDKVYTVYWPYLYLHAGLS